MKGLALKAQVVVLAALLIASAVYFTRPHVYADDLYSGASYATFTSQYKRSVKAGIVNLKWSKAYSRAEDGTIVDASGYEIQYAKNDSFKSAKKVMCVSNTHSVLIKLAELNSVKKYRKYIGRYHFRIRSYIESDGVKTYSRWQVAAHNKVVRVYSVMKPYSVEAVRNTMTSDWERVKDASGYVIYGRKAGTQKWVKKVTITDPAITEYTVKNLQYKRGYEYMFISYKKIKTADPRKLCTNSLGILKKNKSIYNITIPEFDLMIPDVKAKFKKGILYVEWEKSFFAEKYYVEVAENGQFLTGDTLVKEIDAGNLADGDNYSVKMGKYQANKTYYIRMQASGTFKGENHFSDYTDIITARYENVTYTIQFNGNGKTSGSMANQLFNVGEEQEISKNRFKKAGYKFAGWCVEPEGIVNMKKLQIDKVIFTNMQSVDFLLQGGQKLTLYACWKGSGVEAAADWAEEIAADDEFTYGPKVDGKPKSHCWYCQGGVKKFVCNSLVAAAYTHGMPYFKSYWSGSCTPGRWVDKGFTKLGKIPASEIQKGDVICCKKTTYWSHIMIALSNEMVAHAVGGNDARAIRTDDLPKRLSIYRSYCVLRLEK